MHPEVSAFKKLYARFNYFFTMERAAVATYSSYKMLKVMKLGCHRNDVIMRGLHYFHPARHETKREKGEPVQWLLQKDRKSTNHFLLRTI